MKIEQIKKDIQAKSENGVRSAVDKIYEVIDSSLKRYYGEFSPEMYQRTYQLFCSLVETGGGLHGEVYFDAGALNYTTGKWGAAEVLDASMHGSHGGYVGGTAIWDDSMAELGDINALIVRELRAAGLPVH